MTILCSAGKGEMTQQECLDCALRGDNICGYDYLVLKRLHELEDRPDIHVTDLTGCLKRAYLSKTMHMPQRPNSKIFLMLGQAVHNHIEATDEHVDCEVPLEYAGIVGRADAIYKDGRVVDFKTTRWLNPSKMPYGSHIMQVNIYAWMLRRQGRETKSLAIQYLDMTGPTKCRKDRVGYELNHGVIACPVCGGSSANAHLGAVLVEVPVWSDQAVESAIMQRRATLQASLDGNGIVPAAEPSWLCNYCPFSGICPEAQLNT